VFDILIKDPDSVPRIILIKRKMYIMYKMLLFL